MIINTSTIAGLNISEASFKARLPKTGLPFLMKGIQKKLASLILFVKDLNYNFALRQFQRFTRRKISLSLLVAK